jgi:hypothetical protein
MPIPLVSARGLRIAAAGVFAWLAAAATLIAVVAGWVHGNGLKHDKSTMATLRPTKLSREDPDAKL